MRGENVRPAWINECIKKRNAEHSDKPRKPITFLPPPLMEATATMPAPADKSLLFSSLEYRVADPKEELGIGKVESLCNGGDLDLQKFLAETKYEGKENLLTE